MPIFVADTPAPGEQHQACQDAVLQTMRPGFATLLPASCDIPDSKQALLSGILLLLQQQGT